jgi:ribonuclease J
MSQNRLIYLPLGGAGEVGMNCYVYGYGPRDKERLIVVDLGITFPDMDTSPGVDIILPDIAWLEARKDRIDGVFITHAHEDHVGAVGHTFSQLNSPIYARAFTANIARRKLSEHGVAANAVTVMAGWPDTVKLGPFKVGFLPISHSIPESSGLVIDTPDGRIVHTGDFKLDKTPLIGEGWDPVLWGEISKPGVKALVCDSTNVFSKTAGRSEATLGDNITSLVANAKQMVIATTFASNLARVKTLADAGHRAGRSVCLMGRAMGRMVDAAKESGVLYDFPSTISPEEALDVPRGNLMLLVTGSQGERRAASAQLANGKYRGHVLKDGDLFLFSSKVIPGNERGVIKIVNQLSEIGVDVMDDEGGAYHVSGHANRPDLETMHAAIQPQILVPMHGEHRHLREHAKLGNAKGISSVVAVNGMVINLSGNAPKVDEYVETGRTYLDGSIKISALDGVVRDRIRMALNGHVMVSLILDDDGPLGEPWCEIRGLPEMGVSRTGLIEVIEEDLNQFVMRAGRKTMRDDKKLEDELRRIVRHSTQAEIGRKPEVTVVLSRMA